MLKFGRTYIKMDALQVDALVSWVCEMNMEGQDVFVPGLRQKGLIQNRININVSHHEMNRWTGQEFL